MVVDERDSGQSENIRKLGIDTITTDTVMKDDAKSEQLARTILEHLDY